MSNDGPIIKRHKKNYDLQAGYKALFIRNHYQRKNLDFDVFIKLCVQPCFYCGLPPKVINPFGNTYEDYVKKRCSSLSCKEWWALHFIPYTGIDKKIPTPDYSDSDNLVPCCRTCNFMKGTLTHDAFFDQINKILNHKKQQ